MKTAFLRLFCSALLACCAVLGSPAQAQQWPSKPVRIIVPFAAGGGTDIQGRLLGKKFYESLGQTFVVDNRPGASGIIGVELAAKSPADGYTLLFVSASMSVNVSLYGKRMTVDPRKDLAPVSWISSVPLVLVIHPSVPAKSVKELVALARKTGKMNGAHNGAGTTSHLSLEMLQQMANIKVAAVPYKGGGPAGTALISGEVDFAFATGLNAQPLLKAGRIRALAVTTKKASPAFPGLPTMDSLYPGFESDNWYGMFFPAGTAPDIVSRMNAEIVKAIKTKEVSEFMSKEGATPVGSTPDELSAQLRAEIEHYAKVIKAANIKTE